MSNFVVDGKVQSNVNFNQWYDGNEDTTNLRTQTLSQLEKDMLVKFSWQQ